jgi:hypothetical protein
MIWEREDYLDIWPYSFVSLSFANWYQIAVLQDMLDEEVGTPKAYQTYIGELGQEHGLEYSQETVTQFGEANVIDGGFHGYSLTAPQAATIINNAWLAYNETPYEVFCAWTYPWNVATLLGAIIGYNHTTLGQFNPPAIVFGPGANFNSYGRVYFGPMIEDVLCFAVANRDTVPVVGDPTMTMDEMYDALAAQIETDWTETEYPPMGEAGDYCSQAGGFDEGEDQLDVWGMPCYVAALEMWRQAVINAGDVDAEAVRAELVAFDADSPCDTVMGDCWFRVFGPDDDGTGGGVLDYTCHTGEIGQWQAGQIEIVGSTDLPNVTLPNYDITAPFVYPGTWGWIAP